MSKLEMLTDSLVETEHFQKNIVLPYFKDIYKDLASRSEKPNNGIEKFTLLQYCELPGVYGDRFFAILDTDGSGFIELKEFMVGLFRVYCSDFETNLKLAFEFYDFDKDGFISEEDVSLVLSYADINHSKEEEEESKDRHKRKRSQSPSHSFQDRLENQKEIANITSKMFKEKSRISYEEFKQYNTKESSETILCVLKALKTHIPCTDNFYKYLKDYRTTMKAKSLSPPSDIRSSPIAGSTSTTFKAASPSSGEMKNKSFLFTAAKNIKNEKGAAYMKSLVGDASTKQDSSSLTKEELDENILKNATKLKNPKTLRKERLERQATIKESDFEASVDKEAIRMKNVTKLQINIASANAETSFSSEIQSPTNYLERHESTGAKICVCGRNDLEEGKEYCHECEAHSGECSKEGYMYRKTKDKSRIKKYWYKIFGTEIYSYKNEESKTHKTMHSMGGVYISETPTEKMTDTNGKTITLYPIKLVFPHKYRMYYFLEKQEKNEWVHALREAAGYRAVSDYYDMSKKVLGKGKFGIVKLATHKKTGKEVAIKMVSKTEMSPEDLELQRNEIEILKVCQHPSIIRLLDIFENETDIYLVMEYMKGGDLFDYLQRRDFTISESLA